MNRICLGMKGLMGLFSRSIAYITRWLKRNNRLEATLRSFPENMKLLDVLLFSPTMYETKVSQTSNQTSELQTSELANNGSHFQFVHFVDTHSWVILYKGKTNAKCSLVFYSVFLFRNIFRIAQYINLVVISL